MHPHNPRYRWGPRVVAAASVTLAVFLAALAGGCPQTMPPTDGDPSDGDTTDPTPGDTSSTARTCIGCHTDEALLKSVAREEEVVETEDAGEG